MAKQMGNWGEHTLSTLLHDGISPKDCQVLSLGDSGVLQCFRVVSSDYSKPRLSGGTCNLFMTR